MASTGGDVLIETLIVFQDVAVYSTRVMGPVHVHNVAGLACRQALPQRGVAHICFPVSFQSQVATDRTSHNLPRRTSNMPAFREGLPSDDDLSRAAEVLLMIGASLPYPEFSPSPGAARGMQLEVAAQPGMQEWRSLMLERGQRNDTPMKPQRVAHELGQRLQSQIAFGSHFDEGIKSP